MGGSDELDLVNRVLCGNGHPSFSELADLSQIDNDLGLGEPRNNLET